MTQAGGQVITYSYDTSGRLTAEMATDAGVSRITQYAYDAAGNLTKRIAPDGSVTNFTVDANDRLTADGNWSYSFDASGNLVGRSSAAATEAYTYDARGRLTQIVRTGAGAFVVNYKYAADGLLLERRDEASVTRYVWDRSTALPQLLEERDGSGALIRRYESDGVNVTAVSDAAGNRKYYLTDIQGTPRLVVNGDGQVVATATPDAYGQGAGLELVGFANGLADQATGLVFFRSRWYSPITTRFLTPDSAPISQANPFTINRYAYVQGDPVNRTDPTGQEPFTILGITITVAITSGVLTGAGAAVSYYRNGESGSYREMSKNLRSYPTGDAILGNQFVGGIFGLEYATFKPDKSAGLFFTFGGQISVPIPLVDLFVSPYTAGIYDTPRPELYEGFFWSYGVGPILSIPVGVSNGEHNPFTLFGGVTIAWSPTPTFYSNGHGDFRDKPLAGYHSRYSHTIGFNPINIGSIGVNYYFLIVKFGESWGQTRILPDFLFGRNSQLGKFLLG